LNIVDKDIVYNNRNVIRAFYLENENLIRECYVNTKHISSFNDQFNLNNFHLHPLFISIKKNNLKLIKVWAILHGMIKDRGTNNKYWYNKIYTDKRKRLEEKTTLFDVWKIKDRVEKNKPGFTSV